MTRYFYDSYAVLAYLTDHPKYSAYFEENTGVLTKLNLMEVTYRILIEHGLHAARRVLTAFSRYQIDFSQPDILGAMKLRSSLKSRGLDISYADALGYYIAQKQHIRFLTGDQAFKDLPNVEFQP